MIASSPSLALTELAVVLCEVDDMEPDVDAAADSPCTPLAVALTPPPTPAPTPLPPPCANAPLAVMTAASAVAQAAEYTFLFHVDDMVDLLCELSFATVGGTQSFRRARE